MSKSSKMLNYINYRMRITIQDKCVSYIFAASYHTCWLLPIILSAAFLVSNALVSDACLCVKKCSRTLVGTFMAFDRHMNLVLGDCEEYRKVKAKKGQAAQGLVEERCVIAHIRHIPIQHIIHV